jgi:hypothetical protein
MAEQAARQGSVGKPKGGFLRVLFGIPGGVMLMGLVGLILALLGMVGARLLDHPIPSAAIAHTEAAYIAELPRYHPVQLVRASVAWCAQRVLGATYIRAFVRQAPTLRGALTGTGLDKGGAVESLGAAIRSTTMVVLARMSVAMGLLFPLGVVLFAAFQDGLTERELRKYGGDDETALVFAQARGSITTSLGLGLVAYFIAPVALHPHLVLCLLAPFPCLGVFVSVAHFKKFI